MPTIAQPGDVVLVRFPFTDLATVKLRPAVVVATHGDDLTIVGIFSGSPQPPRATWIPLSPQDSTFAQTGLKTSSVIKAERIAFDTRVSPSDTGTPDARDTVDVTLWGLHSPGQVSFVLPVGILV